MTPEPKQVPREGQRRAVAKIIERWAAGEQYTSIVLPTRYGKSDVARISTLIGVQRRLIACSLALSPTAFLVEQFVKDDDWRVCLDRFDSDWMVANGYDPLTFQPSYTWLAKRKLRPDANGEHFISASMQLIDVQQSRNGFWCDWVESVRNRKGLPPAVIVDESHMSSVSNSWGNSLTDMVKAGAQVVLLTATPERSDGEEIPGFHYKEMDRAETTVVVTKPGPVPELVQVDIMQGCTSRRRLVADYEVTYQQAFSENALAHINHPTFDVNMSEVARDSYTGMLSEVPPSRVPAALDKAVRHPDVIANGVSMLVSNLRRLNAELKRPLGIVFCGNDDQRHGATRGENKHLEQVRNEINRQAPEFQVEIFTSADEEATKKLQDFAEGRGARVAVVKQMAGLGLDSPSLKVALDLSTVRSSAASTQRWMRPATPPPFIATLITPADCLQAALFQRLVRDQGGEVSVTRDLILIKSYLKDKDETPSEKDVWRIESTSPGDFDDSKEHHGAAMEYPHVSALLDRFPELRVRYTDAQIAEGIRSMLTPSDDATVAENTGVSADNLRIEINDVATKVIRALIEFRGLNRTNLDYGVLSSEVYTTAYKAAGWPRGVRLDQNNDLRQLRAVRDEMQYLLGRTLQSTG